MKFSLIVKAAAACLTGCLAVFNAHAATWSDGDLFTVSSDYYERNRINHYDAAGAYLDSLTVPFETFRGFKGLTFGNDGLMYAVYGEFTDGFSVLAYDQQGIVRNTWTHSTYVGGNLSYGKIAFGNDGSFYVSGQDELVKFTAGQSSGKEIYTNNQVFDVETLPSGNLLVLSAYALEEITPDGKRVRDIRPPGALSRFTNARGVEYDPLNNDIFVTMLGSSADVYRLLRLDGTTGVVEAGASYWYGDDMVLTNDGRLIVGSRTQAPGIFDTDLNLIGRLGSDDQMFVAQYVSPVPEPEAFLMLLAGLGIVIAARRRA